MSRFLLKRIEQQDFAAFYSLLEADFCLPERKTADKERQAFADGRFFPCWIELDGQRIGYLCYWQLNRFLYVEHFAMCREVRGRHLGTAFLSQFLSGVELPVVLEVERPFDEVSAKRIDFYRYLGFYLNAYDYYQPSYHPGQPQVPMYLCSYDLPLSEQAYADVTAQLRQTVYS